MKKIFIFYCIWYIAMALLMSYTNVSLIMSKIYGALMILNTGFPLIASLAVIITPGLLKSEKTDSKYLNFCFYAGLFRVFFWACAVIGLRDHMIILLLNSFGLAIYALLEHNSKRISNEYFKY